MNSNKKTYETPTVTVHGSIEKLTLGRHDCGFDNYGPHFDSSCENSPHYHAPRNNVCGVSDCC